MSEYLPTPAPQEPKQKQGKKNLDDPLTASELELLYRLFSNPENFPPKFRSWVIDHEAVNGAQIPASRIVGLPNP